MTEVPISSILKEHSYHSSKDRYYCNPSCRGILPGRRWKSWLVELDCKEKILVNTVVKSIYYNEGYNEFKIPSLSQCRITGSVQQYVHKKSFYYCLYKSTNAAK